MTCKILQDEENALFKTKPLYKGAQLVHKPLLPRLTHLIWYKLVWIVPMTTDIFHFLLSQ